MFSNSFFGLGAILPILALFLGYVSIGLCTAGIAVYVAIRASPKPVTRTSQRKAYWPIAALICSETSSVLGFLCFPKEINLGIVLLGIGLLLLWPVSAALAIWGRGVARKSLLVGHGLIAVWICIMLLTICIHRLSPG